MSAEDIVGGCLAGRISRSVLGSLLSMSQSAREAHLIRLQGGAASGAQGVPAL